MRHRPIARTAWAIAFLIAAATAQAQSTKVRFTLDWRYEAPAAAFLLAQGKGYFKAEDLDVTIDAGGGSGMAVTRVASGTYDMGFADLASVMEFQGNNPDAPHKPVGVMMIYNNTPSAIFTLKKSGIKAPADLQGRTLGAPAFDAARRAFPIFAKANAIADVKWTSMDPTLREAMLARGDVEAISGFTFYSPQSLVARGVAAADIVTLPYADYGVKLYGNAIIANPDFAKAHADAVRGMLRAVAKGYRDTMASPEEAVRYLKQREPLIDASLELTRVKALVATVLTSADTRAEGFGAVRAPRLALMATQVSDAFSTKTRVDPDLVFDTRYLPSSRDLNILPH